MRLHQRHTLKMYYYTKLIVHLCELIIVSLGLQLIRNISAIISVVNIEVLAYVGLKLQDWTLVDILRYLLIFRLVSGSVWICDTFLEILKTAGMSNSYSNKNINRASIVMILIGLISCIIAFTNDTHSAWTNILFNNYFEFSFFL